MEKRITSELKSYKVEFDSLHKKIGELEWELATISYGRIAVARVEIERLEDQIANYSDNIRILFEEINDEGRVRR